MIARMVGLLCVATLAMSAAAQTATRPSAPVAASPAVAPAASPAVSPVAAPAVALVASPAGQSVATVNAADVYVRSAASMNAYPCVKLSKPATVTVVGKQGEWLEILPPSDTFSVVDKAMVQADAGNQSGTIKQDTFARAGGALRSNDFTALQCKLKAGEKIKITGDIGDFYRIVPPEGAHLFINARFVDMPGAAPAGRTPLVKPSDDANGPLKSLSTVTITKTSTTTSAPAFSAETQGELAQFQAVEKKLQEAFKGPPDKIDAQGLLADYQDLKVTNKKLKEFVDYRVKFLQDILDRRSKHLATEDMIAQEAKNQGDIDRQIGGIVTHGPGTDLPPPPTAQGVLVESALFQGGATGPKKYTLRDTVFQQINAYVQCTSGAVNLQDYVGKAIAVKGTTKFEPSLKLNVVEVQEVILLDDKFQLPPTNKPAVIEPPAPPVKVAPAFKPDAAKSEPAQPEAAKDADAKGMKEEIILEPIPPEELSTKPASPAR